MHRRKHTMLAIYAAGRVKFRGRSPRNKPLLTDIVRRAFDQRRKRRGLYVLEQPSRPPFQYRVHNMGTPSPPSIPSSPLSDDLARVLDETRTRFVATFVTDCDAIAALVEDALVDSASDPPPELTERVHRLVGLPGTIGFPTVSRRAADLEGLLVGGVIDAPLARVALEKMRRAFTRDLAEAPAMSAPQSAPATGIKILIAEDQADQRNILGVSLTHAGFLPIALRSGEGVIDRARAERPALILLDIAMPGLDGYSVCRLLKADPDLSAIPVILTTTDANVRHRLAGLALGADDFLSKPIDMRELILLIRRRLGC